MFRLQSVLRTQHNCLNMVKASECVTAQSWLYGKAIQRLEPEAIALHTSRGYETPSSKTLMRWSVVASDTLGACMLANAVPKGMTRIIF